MSFKAIKKDSAPDLVVKQILEQINNNNLPPGSRLPSQRDLASMLGVGRSSIREAVNALVVLGYLEPIQGKGTFIRENLPAIDGSIEKLADALKAGSIFDLMEARIMLECRSAALAAERGGEKRINKIQDSLSKMTTENGPYDLFLEADLAFHHAVAEAADNVVIQEMTKLVLDKLKLHHAGLNTRKLSSAYREESMASAMKVADAVLRGDSDGASHWMAVHLTVIKKEISKLI